MFDMMLKSMLPPGVTMEMITAKAGEIAQMMVKTHHTVEQNNALLVENNALLKHICRKLADAEQGAIVTPLVKESNNDHQQPSGIATDPASGPGSASSINGDGDRGSSGTGSDLTAGNDPDFHA